jgi:hypothetical protein
MRCARLSRASILLPTLLLLALTAAPGRAQNLVSNPDFDADDLLWYHDTSTGQQWSAVDADLCVDSGSLTAGSVETSPDFNHFSTRPTDCVAVNPNETLYAALRYRTDASVIRLYFTHCADVDCFNCGSFGPYFAFANASVPWVALGGSDTIPASGVAAVYLSINASLGSASPFTIDLDRVYLGRIDRVFEDDFELGAPCRWSVVH